MGAERFEPARAWEACDGRRPPHTWQDEGTTWGDIDARSRPHAPDGVHARLHEARQMGIRARAPIGHQPIPGVSARMDRLSPGQVMGEEGRDDELQEHPGARLEQPQEPGHGEAAPGPLPYRRAERLL
jgi:hypothetical protein